MKFKAKALAVVFASVIGLNGCSAISTAVKKSDLAIKTTMSETIWLDPVSNEQKTVYLQVRNTSDKQIELTEPLKTKLTQKGYLVLNDPNQAHYWVQANVLKIDKMDLREAQGLLNSGYGAGLAGGALGALAVAAHTSDSNSLAAGGLIGAAIGFAADTLVEDVNYAMVTDLRVVEKTQQAVSTTETASLSNGNSGSTQTTISNQDNKKRYQTRILSTANKVNLDFAEAKPALIDGLATSMTGIF